MKKNSSKAAEPEIQSEYDFSGGIRGKYADRFGEGSNVIVLDPDVAEVFTSSEAVNKALRALAEVARRHAAG